MHCDIARGLGVVYMASVSQLSLVPCHDRRVLKICGS
jgi:hypothetical protein